VGKTFGQPNDIDEKGDLYIRTIAAGKWTPRRREPDVFIDYEVEMRPHGEPNGLTAYIQLKSKKTVVFRDGIARVSMDRKHLEYYLTKALRPVFVALVDVTVGQGYFVFAQEWLRVTSALKKKPGVKTLSIEVREEDKIDDLPHFETAVRRANLYLRDMYPGSPQAAISVVEKMLQEKDPRVLAKVTADGGGTYASLTFQEDISIELRVRAEGDHAKNISLALSDLIGYGKRVALPGTCVALAGSPIFEQEIESLVLGGQESECVLNISFTSLEAPIPIPLLATYGQNGVRFSTPDGLPFHLEIIRGFKCEGTSGTLSFTTTCCFAAWNGINLPKLPWFEFMLRLFNAFSNGEQIRISVTKDGLSAGRGMLDTASLKAAGNSGGAFMLRQIEKLRSVPACSGLVFPATEKLTAADFIAIETIFRLHAGEELVGKTPEAGYCDVEPSDEMKRGECDGASEVTSISGEVEEIRVFNQVVRLPSMGYEMQNVEVWFPAEEIAKAKSGAPLVQLHFRSIEGTRLVYKKTES
jgi:hypothetical protein